MTRVAAVVLLGLVLVTCAAASTAGRQAKTNGLIAFDADGVGGASDVYVVRRSRSAEAPPGGG